jgi:hypothetical protein
MGVYDSGADAMNGSSVCRCYRFTDSTTGTTRWILLAFTYDVGATHSHIYPFYSAGSDMPEGSAAIRIPDPLSPGNYISLETSHSAAGCQDGNCVGYAEDELSQLNFAQQGNVITICHPNHVPAELKMTTAWDTWAYGGITFDVPLFPTTTETTTGSGGTAFPVATRFYGAEQLTVTQITIATGARTELELTKDYTVTVCTGDTANGSVTTVSNISSSYKIEVVIEASWGGKPRMYDHNDLTNGVSGVSSIVQYGDESHPLRDWQWQVTRIIEYADGSTIETMPYTVSKWVAPTVSLWTGVGSYVTGNTVHLGGTYADGATYVPATVTDGRWYVALQNSTNKNPATETAYWRAVYPHDTISEKAYTETDLKKSLPVYPEIPFQLHWGEWVATTRTYRIIATRIYRGRLGRYGFIGETKDNWFIDDGQTPDFSRPPPQGVNPFKVYAADGTTLTRTENPSVVTYFEGRRFFAATRERPARVWGSAVEEYNNFDEIIPPKDSDSLSFELASTSLEAVKALVPRRELIVLTDSSEWVVGGSEQGGLLTPNSIAARKEGERGSGSLQPIMAGDSVIFAQRKGSIPRALVFSRDGGGYQAKDLSLFARHLFAGHTIVDWAYAQDPWQIIWAVRDDGLLLSCTYIAERDMFAWSTHEIKNQYEGKVRSICIVPEDTEDSVYLVYELTEGSTNRILMRLWGFDQADLRLANRVDSSYTWDGRNPYLSGATEISIEYSTSGAWWPTTVEGVAPVGGTGIGEFVTITVTGTATTQRQPFQDLIEGSSNTAPSFTTGALASPGTKFALQLNSSNEDGTFIKVRLMCVHDTGGGALVYLGKVLSNNLSASSRTYSITDFVLCFNSLRDDNANWARIYGDAYTGEYTAKYVADGVFYDSAANVSYPMTLDSGVYAGICHVGIPVVSQMESLDMVPEIGRKKLASAVNVHFVGMNGADVAQSIEDYDAGKGQAVKSAAADVSHHPIDAEWFQSHTPIQGEWSENARVAVVQEDPLPVSIVGITREIEYGG